HRDRARRHSSLRRSRLLSPRSPQGRAHADAGPVRPALPRRGRAPRSARGGERGLSGARVSPRRTMIEQHLETLVIARLATSKQRLDADAIAKQLLRFAPTTLGEADFRAHVAAIVERGVAADSLAARLGGHIAKTWQQLVERALPAIGLGVAP